MSVTFSRSPTQEEKKERKEGNKEREGGREEMGVCLRLCKLRSTLCLTFEHEPTNLQDPIYFPSMYLRCCQRVGRI